MYILKAQRRLGWAATIKTGPRNYSSHPSLAANASWRGFCSFSTPLVAAAHHGPSLAANASRRGLFFLTTTPPPLSRCKREPEGGFFSYNDTPPFPRCKREPEGFCLFFYTTTNTSNPPSQQT